MKKDIKQPQLNLRKVMNRFDVSDQWLADEIHISRQSINAIICGRTDPTLGRLLQIADALKVHLFELFG